MDGRTDGGMDACTGEWMHGSCVQHSLCISPALFQPNRVQQFGAQVGPKLAQVGPKLVPVSTVWFQSGTIWFQIATKLAQNGPRSAQVGAKLAQIGPRWTKLAASLAPSWPRLVRKRPKSDPSSSKLVPRWPKMAPSPFRSEFCMKILRQKSRAEAAKEAIGSQARHATENV